MNNWKVNDPVVRRAAFRDNVWSEGACPPDHVHVVADVTGNTVTLRGVVGCWRGEFFRPPTPEEAKVASEAKPRGWCNEEIEFENDEPLEDSRDELSYDGVDGEKLQAVLQEISSRQDRTDGYLKVYDAKFRAERTRIEQYLNDDIAHTWQRVTEELNDVGRAQQKAQEARLAMHANQRKLNAGFMQSIWHLEQAQKPRKKDTSKGPFYDAVTGAGPYYKVACTAEGKWGRIAIYDGVHDSGGHAVCWVYPEALTEDRELARNSVALGLEVDKPRSSRWLTAFMAALVLLPLGAAALLLQ